MTPKEEKAARESDERAANMDTILKSLKKGIRGLDERVRKLEDEARKKERE